MNDAELSELLSQLNARDGAVVQAACPGEAELAAFVDGRFEPEERRRLREHFADCIDCTAAMALLLRAEEDVAPELDEVPAELLGRAVAAGTTHAPRRRLWTWVAAASWAALAAGASVWILSPPKSSDVPAEDRLRSEPTLLAPPAILFPREGDVVGEDAVLRWEPTLDTLYFEVEIVTFEGDLVWRARTEASELPFPAGAPLTAGVKYFLWVRAYLHQGMTVQSRAVTFSLEAVTR